MPRMKEEQELEAAKLVVQLKGIFQEKLNELLIQRFGYQGSHAVLVGSACHLLASCLTNESLDCDGTNAREESDAAMEEEKMRRMAIGIQVAAAATEAFLRRIYANRN